MSPPCFKPFTGFTPNSEQKLTPFPCPKAPKWLGFCPSFSPRTFSSLAPLQPYWPLLFSSILNLPNTPPPLYLEPCQCFYMRDILLSWSILNLPNSPLPLYLEPCQSFYMRDSFPISNIALQLTSLLKHQAFLTCHQQKHPQSSVLFFFMALLLLQQ